MSWANGNFTMVYYYEPEEKMTRCQRLSGDTNNVLVATNCFIQSREKLERKKLVESCGITKRPNVTNRKTLTHANECKKQEASSYSVVLPSAGGNK